MSDQPTKISIDEIVHAAGAGALRALGARQGSGESASLERLVQSGFGVRFEIWAGGFPGPWGPNGPVGGLGGAPKAGGFQE